MSDCSNDFEIFVDISNPNNKQCKKCKLIDKNCKACEQDLNV